MERGSRKEKPFFLKNVCRGSGKIYAIIETADELFGYELLAHSETLQGVELPAKAIEWRQEGRWILVLAIVGVTQKCTITAVGADGSEIAQETIVVNQHYAHFCSVANRLRRNPVIRQIRDYDDRRGGNKCKVCIDRLVSGGSRPGLVLHGHVLLFGSNEAEVEGKIDLRFFGWKGQDIALTSWVTMRDVISSHPDYPNAVVRELQFSVRIESIAQSATAWAIPRNKKMPQGFFSLDRGSFTKMVSEWCTSTVNALSAPGYDRWYHVVHAVGAAEVALQCKTHFEYEPVFSIIVPLYHTPLGFFREMVESVLRQSYKRFELVLVNSTPEDEQLSVFVDHYANTDGRIVKVNLDENLGITENTNAGILAATGDFLCFLDHDDVLTDDALFCYARALNYYPTTDLLYSDEDHIDALGREYSGPFFKPDWEPDLLLGMNYICHFMCVRKSIVDNMKLPTREFDGSQDHYMALYVSEHARNIYHERRILYHWRIHPDSTANNADAKPYALTAGLLAVQRHLDRCGIKGKAVHPASAPDRYEVEYELETSPLVSIIIPTKDNISMLNRCLRSIVEKSTYSNFEIILAENNSEESATFNYYAKVGDIDNRIRVVTFEGEFNYSAVNNFAAESARGEYLLLLNNDTEVITENWLERMLALCMREDTGVVGAKLLYPDGTIQHCGVLSTTNGPGHMNVYRDWGDRGYVDNTALRQDVAAVTGACLMTEKALYDSLGGLDERFAVSYNDIDYCYAVSKEGKLVVLDPGVVLYHYESVSRGFEVSQEKQLRLTREKVILMGKWPERFVVPDANSNPNLLQNGYSQANFF